MMFPLMLLLLLLLLLVVVKREMVVTYVVVVVAADAVVVVAVVERHKFHRLKKNSTHQFFESPIAIRNILEQCRILCLACRALVVNVN